MTKSQIEKAKEKAKVKYDLAIQIRELLDKARKEFGGTEWDEDDMDNQIIELVVGE